MTASDLDAVAVDRALRPSRRRRARACSISPPGADATRAASRARGAASSPSTAMPMRSPPWRARRHRDARVRSRSRTRGRSKASASTRSSYVTTCTGRCSRTCARRWRADGVLLYETFAMGNEAFGRPTNPDFLLCRDELLDDRGRAAAPDRRGIRTGRVGPWRAPRGRAAAGSRRCRAGHGRRCWRRPNHYRLANRPAAIGSPRPPGTERPQET